MTAYFRSLARRAGGQGGWIRPVLAPVVVPEAAPLIETAEETIAAAEPVDGRAPAIHRHRAQVDRVDPAQPALEPGSLSPIELARALRVRRAPEQIELAAEALGTHDGPVPPPPTARRVGQSTGEARRLLTTAGAPMAATPGPGSSDDTAPGPGSGHGSRLAVRAASDIELVAATPAASRNLHVEPSIGRPSVERERPAPAHPEPPRAVARQAPRPQLDPFAEPIALPAPRESGQVVKVTIGRVEVRAPAPPPPPASRPAPRPAPMMSLADYLRERGERR